LDVLRTPEERFEKLSDYDFTPHFSEIPTGDADGGTLFMHHIDEGPADGEIVLCLHGQPTWSYLYRKMLPVLTAAGRRVIAPDFVGFGRSEKPVSQDDYTYANHVRWLGTWLEKHDLRDVTLFCQDWGGLIGLRVVAEHSDRFARVVTANTALPDGTGVPEDAGPAMRQLYESLPVIQASEIGERFEATDGPPGFLYWRKFCAEAPVIQVSDLVGFAGQRGLAAEQARAYDAPFPDEQYMAGVRKFPSLVPIFPDDPAIPDNKAAWEVLRAFERPFLTAFSDGDPVTRGAEKRFQEEVPGAQGQEHVTIQGAGHFLQEDQGEQVANAVVTFMQNNPLR
jgi:haloalkane dehalogenase